ncbi:MAG: cytidylate kinase [Gemmatimonadetes bacterium]|jgi:cytidylate kinase|nr:cytidylate kinase [Gemmatimonadota bacterium]
MRQGIIAIDGPAASGKSSTARAVAEALGFGHLDSGALYRAITHVALDEAARAGVENPLALPLDAVLRSAEDRGLMLQPDGAGFACYLDGAPADAELRTAAVTSHVSAVSAVPVVREWVNAKLRELARAGVGVVVDGRDIGTVVFPDADLKVFLTATPEARARRRLEQRGAVVDPGELALEAERLALRDRADASRAVAPLRRAHDAVEVDTTSLSFSGQVERIVIAARRALAD